MRFLLTAMVAACVWSFGAGAETLDTQRVKVPMKGTLFDVSLSTYVFTPPGAGPFPVVVMTHGKSPGSSRMQSDENSVIWPAIPHFVSWGYAVVFVVRAGYGDSGGSYNESCDIADTGRGEANSLQAAVDWVKRDPRFDPGRIVLVGQSTGGNAVAALAERNLAGVRAVVNFAGGLQKTSCSGWEGNVVRAFGEYGRKAREATLFVYGDNDSFWGDGGVLPREFFDAYHAGNADSRFFDAGVFENNSHMLFHRASGYKIWGPPVQQFLESQGLPAKQIYTMKYVKNTKRMQYTVEN